MGLFDSVETVGLIYSKKLVKAPLTPEICYGYHALSLDEKRPGYSPSRWNAEPDNTDRIQVWFAGCHADVGGWHMDTGLPDIAMGAVLEKAEKHGLELNLGWQQALSPNCEGHLYNSYFGIWKKFSRVIKPKPRQPPEHAKIHQSVADRMAKIRSYDPPLPNTAHYVSHDGYDASLKTASK